MKIHHELIGTIPAVECFRYSLDELILRYETGGRDALEEADMLAVPPEELRSFMEDRFKDPKNLQRLCDGIAIELCAQHFYGLSGEDFQTMKGLIDAINTYDDRLRFK